MTTDDNAKQYSATGIVGLLDEDLGRRDDQIAIWSVRKARETAWSNREILWRLNPFAGLRNDFAPTSIALSVWRAKVCWYRWTSRKKPPAFLPGRVTLDNVNDRTAVT